MLPPDDPFRGIGDTLYGKIHAFFVGELPTFLRRPVIASQELFNDLDAPTLKSHCRMIALLAGQLYSLTPRVPRR